MEWEKVKYIVIFLLVALNIGLFGLRYQLGQENILSNTQERAVFEVLSRNGITLYTDLDSTAEPMSRLRGAVATYEKADLEEVFFDGEETLMITAFGKTVYEADDKTLELSGVEGVFTDATKAESEESLSRSEALQMGDVISDRLRKIFGEIQLQNVWQKGNTWGLEYVGVYNNELVFSNECIIYLTAEGVFEIDFSFVQITGSESEKKEIVFADQALITFMRSWLELGNEEEIAIQKVSVGYYLPKNTSISGGTELYLEPHYGITTLEDNQKFFVNGYTCLIVDMMEFVEKITIDTKKLQEADILEFLETEPTLEEVESYFGDVGVIFEKEESEAVWYRFDIAENGENTTELAFILLCSFGEMGLEYELLSVSKMPLVLEAEEAA